MCRLWNKTNLRETDFSSCKLASLLKRLTTAEIQQLYRLSYSVHSVQNYISYRTMKITSSFSVSIYQGLSQRVDLASLIWHTFYAGRPSWRNPHHLSRLGTGTRNTLFKGKNLKPNHHMIEQSSELNVLNAHSVYKRQTKKSKLLCFSMNTPNFS